MQADRCVAPSVTFSSMFHLHETNDVLTSLVWPQETEGHSASPMVTLLCSLTLAPSCQHLNYRRVTKERKTHPNEVC